MQVSAGHSHSLFLDEEGRVYKAGDRHTGVPVLVKALEDTRFEQIKHSAALDTKGRLYLLKPGPVLQLVNVNKNFIDFSFDETIGYAVDS